MQNKGVTTLSQFARGCQFSAQAMRSRTSMAALAQNPFMSNNFKFASQARSANSNTAPRSALTRAADRAMGTTNPVAMPALRAA